MTGEKPRIGTGNSIAQRQQHLGDAAHADAADTHQMNALEIVKRDHHACAPPLRSYSTMSRAACGRAICARACRQLDAASADRASKAKISCASRSPVSSGSGISRAAPARTISWALRNWWLSVAAPNGMKMRGAPRRGNFRDGDRARAANDQVRLGRIAPAYSRRRARPRRGFRAAHTPRARHYSRARRSGGRSRAAVSCGASKSTASTTARLIASEPWLPPVISMRIRCSGRARRRSRKIRDAPDSR